MATEKTLVLVFVSPGVGVDGGGWGIDGSGHIHRIPPWNPEVLAAITAATNVMAEAAKVNDKALRRRMERFATSLIEEKSKEILAATE